MFQGSAVKGCKPLEQQLVSTEAWHDAVQAGDC